MFQTITLSRPNISYAVKFLALLTLATAAPLLGFHSQWITGPIVNAALILAVYLVGVRGAILIGLLPSTIALSTGLLPAVLAPMIPFIIISNIILVLILDYFKKVSSFPARNVSRSGTGGQFPVSDIQFPVSTFFPVLFLAAGLKYLFLLSTSSIIINLLLNQSLAPAVSQMLAWPQFFTVLIGGGLAWGVMRMIKK